MKYIFYFLAFATMLSSCSRSATKINASIKTTTEEPKKFNRLAVLAMLPKMSSRATIEVAMDDKLTALGVRSMATFNVFPFAGNKEVLDKMDLHGEALRAKVRERVKTYEIDALMTISLLDAKKEERYVQGSSLTISGPAYYSAYPEYAYSYYDYYAYAYTTVYDRGYYTTTTTYFLEINLYDIATENLIWTAQTKTKDPSSIEKEAKNFANLVVNELFSKKVIKK
jgi:hypothetical protein